MTNHDALDCFRALQYQLSPRGLESEAICLEAALIRGTTDAERLEMAGKCLVTLRAAYPALCDKALAPYIAPCVSAVQRAWPDFR